MNNDHLLKGESILSYSDGGLVTLTSHRIRYEHKVWGGSNIISIMLEKVSSVQIIYISYPWLWIMGVLVGVIGMLASQSRNGGSTEMVIAFFIAFFLIIGYFLSRRHICSITSDGGTKIIFRTENMTTESMIEFMNKIESAKSERFDQRAKQG